MSKTTEVGEKHYPTLTNEEGFIMELQKLRSRGIFLAGITCLAIMDIVRYHSYGIIAMSIFFIATKKRKGVLCQVLQEGSIYFKRKERIKINLILGLGITLSYLMARKVLLFLILPYFSGLLWGNIHWGFQRRRELIKQYEDSKE